MDSSLVAHRDEMNRQTVFRVTLCDSDIAKLRLNCIDKAVIESEAKTAADMLQSLEIIFRRLHEQTKDPAP